MRLLKSEHFKVFSISQKAFMSILGESGQEAALPKCLSKINFAKMG